MRKEKGGIQGGNRAQGLEVKVGQIEGRVAENIPFSQESQGLLSDVKRYRIKAKEAELSCVALPQSRLGDDDD